MGILSPLCSTETIERPELESAPSDQQSPEWKVVVYNNETNTYEEVMLILVIATGCTDEEAYIETWEIDHFGRSCVHFASEKECHSVAEVIRTIGIEVKVEQED